MELLDALKLADTQPDGSQYARGRREKGIVQYVAMRGEDGRVLFRAVWPGKNQKVFC